MSKPTAKRNLPIGLNSIDVHICLNVHDNRIVQRTMTAKGLKPSKFFSTLINQGLAAKLPVFEVEE